MTQSTLSSRALYVLDTNILLHDPYSLFKFEEHDIYIPIVTVEELDNKKSGNTDVNRNARQATRAIAALMEAHGGPLSEGVPLNATGNLCTGEMYIQHIDYGFNEGEHFRKNDNLYLKVLEELNSKNATEGRWSKIVMVSKDLNLRIKAQAQGFLAEDYLHDHAVEDADMLYSGIRKMNMTFKDFLESRTPEASMTHGGSAVYVLPLFKGDNFIVNEFLEFQDEVLYRVQGSGDASDEAVISGLIEDEDDEMLSALPVGNDDNLEGKLVIKEIVSGKYLGVSPNNPEQRAALDLLLDDDIDLVALLGPAGTGKTLLTLVAALHQRKQFNKIVFTRTTVPVGDDIGFLPGTEEEKMAPWAGAIMDNVDFLKELNGGTSKELQTIEQFLEIKAVTFMRGRTLAKTFLIVDEAQNATPKQIKTLITRAGEGTKVVLLGNLAQIDSPYLTETSSGLSFAAERFKGWSHFGSVILQKGKRSRLANEANVRL